MSFLGTLNHHTPLVDKILIPFATVAAAAGFMDVMNGVVVVLTAILLIIRIIKTLTSEEQGE